MQRKFSNTIIKHIYTYLKCYLGGLNIEFLSTNFYYLLIHEPVMFLMTRRCWTTDNAGAWSWPDQPLCARLAQRVPTWQAHRLYEHSTTRPTIKMVRGRDRGVRDNSR